MVIALFVDNEYSVENEILIKQPKAVVFTYVNSLRNQDKFSKLANIDSNIKKSYSGTDRTVVFVSAWESDHPEVKPATKTRIDLGLKLKEKPLTDRLENSGVLGAMLTHRVRITSSAEIDQELNNWFEEAYKTSI